MRDCERAAKTVGIAQKTVREVVGPFGQTVQARHHCVGDSHPERGRRRNIRRRSETLPGSRAICSVLEARLAR